MNKFPVFKMPKVEFDIGGTIFRTDKITLMEKASGSRLAAETQKVVSCINTTGVLQPRSTEAEENSVRN